MSKMQIKTVRLYCQDSQDNIEQEKMRIHRSKSKKDRSAKSGKMLSEDNDAEAVARVWIAVAGEFDVRNATPREIMSLSRQLYEANAISYDDHINLSFQPEINLDSSEEISSFSHQRKDYIALWQQRADKVIRFGGDRHQIEDNQRIQAILNYVDSLK